MHLNYSELEFDKNGLPEQPELVLQTMGDDIIGTIPGVHNLKINIKFSEPSTIKFDVAAKLEDGEDNWIYDHLTGYKVVYTEKYGIYLVTGVTTEGDGISDVKHIECNSIEYVLNTKKFFIEEGTFRFCDLTDVTNEDTVIGRILEIAKGWSIGYVSPALAQKYRTFEQYDEYLLSFMYGDAKDKYRCIFVFDPYERTISAYDADEETSPLPIYLDFDNLVTEIEVEELTDELVTAIRPYGADELNIIDVNPIGSNWIYDLSYFIENGDISAELAEKWTDWQDLVLSNQELYKNLTALQSSSSSKLFAAQVALTELRGELETLQAQQSVTIQALAMETTAAGKSARQQQLDAINGLIASKEERITDQEELVESIQEELDPESEGSYANQIRALVNTLSLASNFTDEEREVLSKYFIEQDITEDTFVASSVTDASTSASSYVLTDASVSLTDSHIVETDYRDKLCEVLTGGSFTVTFGEDSAISGEIIGGTLEMDALGDNSFVLSLYASNISSGTATAQSGTVIVTGKYDLASYDDDIAPVTVDEVTTREGTQISFDISGDGSLYLTSNVSDYQKYSVQTELYDFAVSTLSDLATPTYEFSVDSGNFIFSQEFEPFRNELRLGRGIYLNLGHDHVITPNIIEFELDFEDYSKFSMVFSNRFKRYDQVNTLKDMVEKSYSYSRSFDASKHIYNQSVSQSSAVSKYMQDALDSAVNTIIGASNQSVIINGAGIHVSGPVASGDDASAVEDFQLRIVNGMIAMTKDNWVTADLAIGAFKTDSGYHFGVNAEVIGGNLIVGNELIIEAPQVDQQGQPTGVMQFKVDGSGAWLNNSTFVLQSDANNGGKIIIDPQYGILAGDNNLYTINGTTVTPSFIDTTEDPPEMTFDNDGMPTNANFFLDINNGNAYFRGKVNATSGQIGGFTLESDYMHAGSGTNYIALNGSGSNANSTYAIWAGNSSPGSANFSVTKAGKVTAKNIDVTGGTITIGNNFAVSETGNITANSGTFKGTLDAAKVSGDLTAASGGGWLSGCGIKVGANSSAANGYNFYVDTSGNVSISGNLTLGSGVISWSSLDSGVQSTINTASSNASSAYNLADSAADDVYDLARGQYTGAGTTFISGKTIYSPTISAGSLSAVSGTFTGQLYNTSVAIVNPARGTPFGTLSYSNGGLDINSMGGLRLYGNYNENFSNVPGNIWMQATGYSSSSYTSLCLYSPAASSNASTAVFNCAVKGLSWTDTSDISLKNTINYDLTKYEEIIKGLKPCSFKFNSESNKTHFGFIAQDIKANFEDHSFDSEEYGVLSVFENEEKEMIYGLAYDEFIALQQWQIQKLESRIEALESLIEV